MEFSTQELLRKRVWTSHPRKNDPDFVKKVGRIRAFVFHPTELRCVGFLVKRPDAALMFRRPEIFVALNGFIIFEGDIVLTNEPHTKDQSACKALGINLDHCIIWDGLPVLTQDGTSLGFVENVFFDSETGAIETVQVGRGSTATALLGKCILPADQLVGFRFFESMKHLANVNEALKAAANEAEPIAPGAIVVLDSAKEIAAQGGLAEKAGAATAVVADATTKTVRKVKKVVKPKTEQAAKAAGKAAEQGAFVTGRQIARAQGMFRAFSDEFKKSSK